MSGICQHLNRHPLLFLLSLNQSVEPHAVNHQQTIFQLTALVHVLMYTNIFMHGITVLIRVCVCVCVCAIKMSFFKFFIPGSIKISMTYLDCYTLNTYCSISILVCQPGLLNLQCATNVSMCEYAISET